jgi:hypothetical protein
MSVINFYKQKLAYFFLLLIITQFSTAQDKDTSFRKYNLRGSITATNNGISLIPSISLGKPAILLTGSIGSNKISFDPEFRFSMEGKPWILILGWRYKMINQSKFKITVGIHPLISFKEITAMVNGTLQVIVQGRRFLDGEIAPNYFITKNTSIGCYYLYQHGFEQAGTRNGHFFTLNCNMVNIRLPGSLRMRVNPQVYYLTTDGASGYYCTSTFSVSKAGFPVSVSSIMSKIIRTDIAGENFVWNLSVTYAFSNQYAKAKNIQ